MRTTAFTKVLESIDPPAVLVDVGASGGAPGIWLPIARYSVYVGFDPDRRDFTEGNAAYLRFCCVRKAVTPAPSSTVRLNLTRSPHCSSLLVPNKRAINNYIFAGLFHVKQQIDVEATTIGNTLSKLGIQGVDWLKTDSQGIDLRLFSSIPSDIRSGIMAVDVEPGLTDFYCGEDVFTRTHDRLTRSGFWCSDMETGKTVRMNQSTLSSLCEMHPSWSLDDLAAVLRRSPGWVNARYLRSSAWLSGHDVPPRSYRVLWVFATILQQDGFALEIGMECKRRFPKDGIAAEMEQESIRRIEGRLSARRVDLLNRKLLTHQEKKRVASGG